MARMRSSQGFTLIEIMVAVLLLVIVMAGFVPVFLSGLAQASSARHRSLANNIARERMEQVRQLDYREIQEDGTTAPENLSQRFGTTTTVRGIDFTVTYSVTNSTSSGGQLKKVAVSVTWTGSPPPSPALVQTLIHQQFLGPRGAYLTVIPTPTADPLGSPFPLLSNVTNTAEYHVATADWSAVYDNLNQPSMAPKNVYLRLAFVNDAGQVFPLGLDSDEYRIDNSHLRYSLDAGNQVNDVWFEYDFEPTSIPDGYWELQALMYNQFDQPGNLWRLRVRIEDQPPFAPTGFGDIGPADGVDDGMVRLTWIPGPETDRASYALARMKQNPDGTWPTDFTALIDMLLPTTSTYIDEGDVAAETDPWGDGVTMNSYVYRLTVVDLAGNATEVTSPVVVLPRPTTTTLVGATTTTTTTTVTTTSTSTTSTTAGLYGTEIKNDSNKSYSITIKDGSNATVFTGTAAKHATLSVTPLPAGSYQITATAAGRPTLNQSFSLPLQANQIVLLIN